MATFHWASSQSYHDNPSCPIGLMIDASARIEGTGGKPRCLVCEEVDSMRGKGEAAKGLR